MLLSIQTCEGPACHAAQGVPPCSLVVSDAGGGGFVVLDSTGRALFSTLRVLTLPYNGGNASSAVYDIAAGTWSAGGPFPAARLPAVTRLHDGSVLAAGGEGFNPFFQGYGPSQNVSRFSPASLKATDADLMISGRDLHQLVTLFNGSALAIGGIEYYGGLPKPDDPDAVFNPFFEIYSPNSGTWRRGCCRPLITQRAQHVSIVLQSGKVLTTGGLVGGGDPRVATNSAEVFDASSGVGVATAVGNMSSPRIGHAMALLPDGTVLACGGASNGIRLRPSETDYLFSCDLFIPSTGLWVPTGNLTVRPAPTTDQVSFNPWVGFQLSLLPNGQVLAWGGSNQARCEQQFNIYDVHAKTWSVTPTAPAFYGPQILLPTGQLLAGAYTSLAACQNSSATRPTSTILYDPLTGKQTVTGSVPASILSQSPQITPVLF